MAEALPIAGGLAAVATLLACWALLRPWRVSVSGRARADEGGWAAAGGVELGPLSASCASAHRLPVVLTVHAFGRKLRTFTVKLDPSAARGSAGRLWTRVERFVDPLEVFAFLFAETRRIAIERLRLEVKGGFEDPSATASAMGVLATAAGFLAPIGTIAYEADWSGVTQGECALDCSVSASPLLCGVDTIRFAFRNVHLRAPRQPAPAPQPS